VTFDLLHRIRWANVARAAAVALALLLALAWPRLRAHPDALPPAVEPAPAAVAKSAAVAKATHTARLPRVTKTNAPRGKKASHDRVRKTPKRSAAKPRVAKRHRHARHRGPRSPRSAVPTATSTPAYVVPAGGVVPAAEFRP
jgi:hypothetical protein